MRCTICNHDGSFVKDSRYTDKGFAVRRRRVCNNCKHKFTTIEKIHNKDLIVIKRSGSKKLFDKTKVQKSIATATRKRNLSYEQVDNIANAVIQICENTNLREIQSRKIGDVIMDELAKVDQVSYIRFASVYKDFSSARDFANFISKLKNK